MCRPRSLEVVCQPQVQWLCANPRSSFPFNELILGWELGSTHIVIRLLKLINTKYIILSTKPCHSYSLICSLS
jgi:hypothetical protein